MKQGDTCRFRQEEGKRHLWVVLSDPGINESEVLLVHLTTKTDRSDLACLVQPGEHPFVHAETAVNYAKPRVMSVGLIEKLGVEWREPVAVHLLQRLLEGARDSDRIINAHRQILVDQGFIDVGED